MEGCSIPLIVLICIAAAFLWRRLSDRVRSAEKQLLDLELEIARLRGTLEGAPGEPEVAVEVVPRTIEPPQTVPISEAETPEPPAFEPAPPGAEVTSLPARPKRPPTLRVDWERWVGVRGAAVLGGVVLALAALLFLKYSIEHGLIPPIVRVIAGMMAGLAAIWWSEGLRKRGYEATGNALAGSGVVILYAATWAASRLYGLIPTSVAFALMILVTIACGVLAWRHRSLVIAVLGLAGGFATPLLLGTEADNPLGLFGYLLVLNAGLLILARRRRWPILGLLGLLATVSYQALWIFFEMDEGDLILGLAILAVFALLFAVAAGLAQREAGAERRGVWLVSQVGGVLLPFLFALYFAGNAELGEHLWAVAGLMLLLSVAADRIARIQQVPGLATAAAAANLGVLTVWCARTRFDDALAWEAVVISLALALAFHLSVELDLFRARSRSGAATRSAPTFVAATGHFLLLILVATLGASSFWPWLTGWAGLTVLLVRQAWLPGLAYRQVVASALLAAGFACFFVAHSRTLALPPALLFFGFALIAAVAFQLLSFARAQPDEKRQAELAGIALPLILLVGLVGESMGPTVPPGLYHTVTILLALLVVLASTRLGEGRLILFVMVLLACEHSLWTASYQALEADPEVALLGLTAQTFAALVFTAWPFLAAKKLLGDRWTWYAAALAGPVWFLSLKSLFDSRFGDGAIGLLPLALGTVSLAAAHRSRGLWPAGHSRRTSNLAWFAAVALGFLSVAIPLQLEKEWITIGWALEGIAVAALWKRLDHPGLKHFALALLAAVTVRLVANPALLGYYQRSGWPVFNWLMYTYLVPAAALLGSSAIFHQVELKRVMKWEKPFYSSGYPLAAIGCGLSAILVVFVWINLTIFDAFSAGSGLSISLDRLPARDLTLSLAWAVYALVLLAVGMARNSQGLRWISLAFLVLTIGKVFLYDLGELEDLYRVASLLGLAFSLILVSLAYQRFVFRKRSEESE